MPALPVLEPKFSRGAFEVVEWESFEVQVNNFLASLALLVVKVARL